MGKPSSDTSDLLTLVSASSSPASADCAELNALADTDERGAAVEPSANDVVAVGHPVAVLVRPPTSSDHASRTGWS
jgi:hypothetical protein